MTRAILITGASSGIGATSARELAGRGCLVFAGMRTPPAATSDRTTSDRVVPIELDVTDAASIAAAVARVNTLLTEAGLSGLHGLVNNAGIAISGPLEIVPTAELRRQFEVNVFGAMAVTQASLSLLRRGARIVNMGSIAGRSTVPLLGPYAASKSALASLTDALRQELKEFGIDVSLIEPGSIATPIWGKGQRASETLEHDADPTLIARYADVIARVRRAAITAERGAIPPEAVARAVTHALLAPKPRTRYLVGLDARVQAVLKAWLPDRLHDSLLRRIMA